MGETVSYKMQCLLVFVTIFIPMLAGCSASSKIDEKATLCLIKYYCASYPHMLAFKDRAQGQYMESTTPVNYQKLLTRKVL